MDLSKLKRYVALKIKFDPITGKRAGDAGIKIDEGRSIPDPNLICCGFGWQNVDKGVEIRLIVDDERIDEYIERYKDVEGIEILEGIDAINLAVDEIVSEQYMITSPELLKASIEQMNIKIDDLHGKSRDEMLKTLYQRGALGVEPRHPFKLPKKW